MSTEDNKAAVRRYVAALERRDVDATHIKLTEAWTIHFPGAPAPLDREGASQATGAFFDGFPDLHATIDEQIAEGDNVVTRVTWEGTHTAEFMGIPATGKSLSFEVVRIDRFEGDKIAHMTKIWNSGAALKELGWA